MERDTEKYKFIKLDTKPVLHVKEIKISVSKIQMICGVPLNSVIAFINHAVPCKLLYRSNYTFRGPAIVVRYL